MENTLENKEKLFAQYYGQKVLNCGLKDLVELSFAFMTPQDVEYGSLELKSLSLMTDEEAIDLNYGNASHLKSNILYNIDELRLRGFALNWCGLSIEKQIEYGWIKLI